MNTAYGGAVPAYTRSTPLSTSPAAHLEVTIRRNSELEHDVTGGVAGSGAVVVVRCTRVTSRQARGLATPLPLLLSTSFHLCVLTRKSHEN